MLELLLRHRQLLVFLVGGVLSVVIDVGLMQLLIASGVNYIIATTAGFGAGLLFNFSFHARLTFKSAISAPVFLRYLCVVALNYLITLAFVALAQHLVGDPLSGKILALFIVPVISFLLGKYWTFK